MSYLSFPLDSNVADVISTPDLDDNSDFTEDNTEDTPDLPNAVRIDLAHKAWKDANGELHIRKATRTFGVSESTLRGRIKGAVPKAQASQAMQRLTVAEEEAIRDW